MTTPGEEGRDTAPPRAPGAMHVPTRATGRSPEWGSRLRQQQNVEPAQQEPQRLRSIITMRHVREHLPAVEGELMAALEEEGQSSSIDLNDEAAYEEVKFAIPDREYSSGSTNLSIGDISDSSSAKEAKLGTAKAFLQGGLSKISWKNRKISKQKQQKPSPTNRRKILREKLLAQPSLLLPPDQAESLRLALIGDVESGRGGRGTIRQSGVRPSLERNRNTRGLPSQAAIPECRSTDLHGKVRDTSFTPTLTETVVVIEEEASEAVIVLDHILELFPDADPNDACCWVAEGRSVRNILGELCHARRASLHASTLSGLSEEQFEELDAAASEPHNEEDAINEEEEISEMVRQIQDFFPGVNVDRSYAMLRDMSLQEALTELAEESLNNSADCNTDNSDDSRSGVDETMLQHAQEAFPQVEREELKVLLREMSLSGVMLQLLDGPSSQQD